MDVCCLEKKEAILRFGEWKFLKSKSFWPQAAKDVSGSPKKLWGLIFFDNGKFEVPMREKSQ